MKRDVELVHRLGSRKYGLVGTLVLTASPKTSRVTVPWDLHGIIEFSATSGLEVGKPRGQWRLSEEDVAAFCEALKIKPIARKLAPLKPRKPKLESVDPRQLSLVEK